MTNNKDCIIIIIKICFEIVLGVNAPLFNSKSKKGYFRPFKHMLIMVSSYIIIFVIVTTMKK